VLFYVAMFRGKVSRLWLGIKLQLVEVWKKLKSVVSSVFLKLKQPVTTLLNYFKDRLKALWEWWNTGPSFFDNLRQHYSIFRGAIQNIWNRVKNVYLFHKQQVLNRTKQLWNTLTSLIKLLLQSTKDRMKSAFNSAKMTVKNSWNGLKNAVVVHTQPLRQRVTALKVNCKRQLAEWIARIKLLFLGIIAINNRIKTSFASMGMRVKQSWNDVKNTVRVYAINSRLLFVELKNKSRRELEQWIALLKELIQSTKALAREYKTSTMNNIRYVAQSARQALQHTRHNLKLWRIEMKESWHSSKQNLHLMYAEYRARIKELWLVYKQSYK
jgi:hypothetical protein